jgi:APA family basic amino acid/polyamine antiporter
LVDDRTRISQDSGAGAGSGFARELNFGDGTAIVVGTIIGSGIFLVPRGIARDLSSIGAVVLVWIVGGALSLFGGLALGELGSMFPDAGGLYVYLRRIYGKPLGFLYGWGLLTIIHSGSIATLAVAFRLYLGQMFSLNSSAQKLTGISCVLFLTGLNCFGLRPAKIVQNISALAKIAGLAAMVVLVSWHSHRHWPAFDHWFQGDGGTNWVRAGTALVAVLWAYEGWHVVSFTAGEFKRPQRDLPRALFCGTLIVAFVYILANLAYYSALTRAEIQASDCVAATAMYHSFGAAGATAISALIVVSIFGAANGMVLTGPRVYYAMASDGLFLRSFTYLTPQSRTPIVGLVIQGAWASLLTVLGTFTQLFTYVIFTSWIFYALAVAGVVMLRIREPQLKRPFRAPALLWFAGAFVVAALGMSLSTIVSDPRHALIGIALILSGLPVYALVRTKMQRKGQPTTRGLVERANIP